jgi:hypothetical protein
MKLSDECYEIYRKSMESRADSPRIVSHEWGVIDVEGAGRFRDAKLWPGGGREWDWDETGTHHEPGIQPTDLDELLTHDPEVVVLSRGRELRLQAMTETIAALQDQNIEVVHDETSRAIDAYNRLAADGRRVAALLHSTC